ncbi:MAG: DUF3990 domain-containing protein [Endomicrobium sp.]|jgi:hypothetical protein|nr:DUF3990 domain-containing protein [Endomicrobium sp.]
MILYHGSNVEIESVALDKCRPFRDFGRGFYTTIIKGQAVNMAKRTVRIYGGNPIITSFYFDEKILKDKSFNVKIFDIPTNEWAVFVSNNRNNLFLDIKSIYSNSDNKYDVVYGPVANDDLALIFRQYTDGILTIEMLRESMKYKKLSNQISFHTQKSVNLLKKIGVFNG